MKEKVLFLDFDGVLFDTLKEVYLVNRQLYQGTSLFDKVDSENYSLYSKYKYLVYNIWMFYYYNPLLFDGCNNIELEFKKATLNRNLQAEEDFCSKFLSIRAELVKNNYDFWKTLETPYEFFFGIKKIFNEGFKDIYIVSKKNKNAILERFATYSLNIPSDNVFAREVLDKYSNKGEFMAEFMTQNAYKTALFVDDNQNNLKTCDKFSQIKTILALWGNCQPDSIGCSQNEALNKIENFIAV